MAWSDHFHSPIIVPGNRKPLETILDAARYMTSLPRHERGQEYWRPAATLIPLVGEGPPGGDQFFAQLTVQFGLRKGARSEPIFDHSRKDTHWGKHKLKRDR